MSNLLPNLSKELESYFSCAPLSSDQLRSNLSVLAEQLQLLITSINQNLLNRGILQPDIGISAKIKLIGSLANEATQLYRNAEAETVTAVALEKEIRRKRRVLRKLKRNSNADRDFKGPLTGGYGGVFVARSFTPSLSPIRESIPLPPPPAVRFRVRRTSSSNNQRTNYTSAPSTLDTDELLEFDLV